MPDAKISQLDPVAGADAADELPIARTNTTKKLTVQQVSDFAQTGVVLDGDAAGGVLSGTYPNPGFAVDMATQAELDAVAAAAQPLDATLTALAGQNWAANAIPVGTGADTVAQTALAANTFLARSSAGNVAAKSITDFALTVLDDADQATARTTLGVGTGDSPQFAGVNVGNASDTTITRTGAGDIAVEGNAIYRAGGTDVPLADGGTGASLADPNADRIMFWDDSAGQVDWLTPSTGLSISATSLITSRTVRTRVDIANPQASANQGNSFWTVLGLTDWDAGHWEFVKDVDGKAYGTVMVPSGYISGGNLILSIAANATSGVTRWVVGTKAVADGESLNPTLTDETAQDITVPGTAYLRKDITFTLTETLAAGDILIVELYHNGAHANDTLAVNTLLFGAWLEVTAT